MSTQARVMELPPQYDPGAIEREIYAQWLAGGAFRAHAERSERVGGPHTPFTIVIATQNVVEKALKREGQTRFDLGRAAFVARTEAFVAETGGRILKQLEAIGASCDWSRTAYTLSPELSLAVREAFVRLYDRGLIYRGHRVIHWCPRCLTSLSDEEAEHEETAGTLYHVAYPLVDGDRAEA